MSSYFITKLPPTVSASTVNSQSGKGREMSAAHKAWRTEQLWELRTQTIGKAPLHFHSWVRCQYSYLIPRNKDGSISGTRPDVENLTKCTSDVLVEAGVAGILGCPDDKMFWAVNVTWAYEQEHAVMIEIDDRDEEVVSEFFAG